MSWHKVHSCLGVDMIIREESKADCLWFSAAVLSVCSAVGILGFKACQIKAKVFHLQQQPLYKLPVLSELLKYYTLCWRPPRFLLSASSHVVLLLNCTGEVGVI